MMLKHDRGYSRLIKKEWQSSYFELDIVSPLSQTEGKSGDGLPWREGCKRYHGHFYKIILDPDDEKF